MHSLPLCCAGNSGNLRTLPAPQSPFDMYIFHPPFQVLDRSVLTDLMYIEQLLGVRTVASQDAEAGKHWSTSSCGG